MCEYKKYVKKWQDCSIKMNEAMQKGNFELADRLLKESTDAYNRFKECSIYPESNRKRTFGELNYMLESELPFLFKKNKKALKECTMLVKEDRNLRSAFRFIDALRRYNCEGDPRAYVSESLELASDGLDRKTFRESVKKLADMLSKYEIGGCSLDEGTVRYFKACEKLLMEEKRLTNLTDCINSANIVASYIESHKSPVVESRNGIDAMTEELDRKIANLTEEEQTLVQDIIDFKKPMVEARQEQLFNRFKNECLGIVEKLMSDASDDEKLGLGSIREQLENKSYCKETIVQDIANLLEIRDVLSEK
jgi:hypothetical protein